MIAKPSIFYPHRRNQYGSYTPICLRCLAQVARADGECEFAAYDNLNECNPARLAERYFVEPPHLLYANEAKQQNRLDWDGHQQQARFCAKEVAE
jgi:hypothetical protein